MKQEKVLATLVIIIFSMICLGIIFTQNLFSDTKPFELRINVGGEQFTDSRGQIWMQDHIYRSGYGYLGISGTYSTRELISGTSVPDIYQSERYKLFGYRIDVPNGHYEIILHFAEIYHERKNKRIMEIKLEDVVVENNLDIYDRVGKNVALALVYNTRDLGKPITDKCIDIEITNKKDDTKLSGIEIIQMFEQPTILKFEPNILDFGTKEESILLKINNIGTIPAMWRFDNISFPSWMRVPNPQTGKIKANSFISIPIEIDRTKIRGGLIRDTLRVVASEYEQKIPVSVAVPGVTKLNIVNPTLEFGTDMRNLTCRIRNDGGSKLRWFVDNSTLPPNISRVYPSSGEIEIGESRYLNVIVTRDGLTAGTHTKEIVVQSGTNSHKINAIIEMPASQEEHLYVNSAATGLNNGSSWKDAYHSVKDAVTYAQRYRRNKTTEIWVAQGTYYEYNILVPSGVELYGGFTGTETVREERTNPWAFPTVIDAGRRGRCFEALHKTVIDGFVIQNGRDWNSGEGKGAAILTYDADVQIRNNLIRKNVDSWAGAIFIEGFDRRRKVANASPLIEHNVLIDNFSNYCAAAIEIRGSAATIRNNTIVGNKGFGLEIQDLLGPYQEVIYGKFYNNIVVDNVRQQENDVWAEARKSTDYSYVGKCWNLEGTFKPYDYGEGNIFGDVSAGRPGFIDKDDGDFRLRANSPCINSGHPNLGTDPDGTRTDMGAFPFDHDNGSLEIKQKSLYFNPEMTIRSIKIKAYGNKPVKWEASCYPDNEVLVTIRPASGVLQNGEEAVVSFSYIPSGLKDGIYNGFFAFATDRESYEGTWSVLVNNSSPVIEADVAEVVIEQEIGGSALMPQRVRINNAGYGSLDWKAKKRFGGQWLDFSELSGINVDMLTLMFNTSNLDFGEYYEEIIISDPKTANKEVTLPVRLKMVPGKFVYEVEAEQTKSLPNKAWKLIANDGAMSIQAMENSLALPDSVHRLNYDFTVPEDVELVYVFAEVDVNGNRSNDSFWVSVNGFDPCLWDNVNSKLEGWNRAWVYHQKRDRQHIFVVRPGENTLNVYTRESGGFINWFVITNDPDMNIQTYQFGKMTQALKRSASR